MDTNQIISGVLALIVVTAMLLVGNSVNTSISTSMLASTTGAQALATAGNITDKSEDAFALTANVPTILGATIILVAVGGLVVLYRS